MNLNKLKKTFIIAEIGNNHEGSFNVACKLIKEAKKAGVDAVKFQTFKTEDFINPYDKKRFRKLKKFELSYEEFEKLSVIAKNNKLKFISTPLDINSAIFLNNIVDCFKIASGDNNYYDLIKTVLNFDKTTFISTGLLDFIKVKSLVKFIKKIGFNFSKLSLFHCVSDYPVSYEDANLLSIKFLKAKLPLTIGYSDHTIGREASIVAVSLGAKIIEKHFTLSNNFSKFRDHQISLNPRDMKQLVSSIRKTELMLGVEEKRIQNSEFKNLDLIRRSIYSANNFNENSIIKKNMIKILRPANIYKPNDLKKILNKKIKKKIGIYKVFLPNYFI
jgi:N,N'-diacetyllegionaminate synthase